MVRQDKKTKTQSSKTASMRNNKVSHESKTTSSKSLKKVNTKKKTTAKKIVVKKQPIQKKEIISEKKDSKSLWVSVVAVVLIAFIGAFFILNSNKEVLDYSNHHGFSFEERGQYWVTFVELDGVPYEAPFNNHPLDLTHISYDDSITEFVLSVPHASFIIAVSDHVGSTPVLAGANIARITGKLYGMPTSSALFATPDQRDNATLIRYVDCTDATVLTPIFWINVNDTEQRIYADEENPNCIIIGGTNNEEILASADLLAYKILQIE